MKTLKSCNGDYKDVYIVTLADCDYAIKITDKKKLAIITQLTNCLYDNNISECGVDTAENVLADMVEMEDTKGIEEFLNLPFCNLEEE